jgi:anaerobic magnesium-protoporphyrin IX monomethyl ester cyclase
VTAGIDAKMKKRVALINPLEQSPLLDLHSDTTLQPRYGTVSVATRIRDAGYDIRFFCEMSGSTIDWDYVAGSDYVCFSLMSFCSHRGYALMQKVRGLTEAPILCGGSHATVLPEECLDEADYVVRNEGEAAVIELLGALSHGRDVAGIAGISYKTGGAVVHQPDREFIADLNWSADYTLIDGYGARETRSPAELSRIGKPWFHFPVSQISRGCPRSCRFCFVRRELGNRYRKRDVAMVRAEIEGLAQLLCANQPNLPILFVDNDFCLDQAFTLRCLEGLSDLTREYNLEYQIFTRIETARDRAFIRKIRALGVGVVFLGIESIRESTLRLYGKDQSKPEIIQALKVCRDNGMNVLGFFVLGADTDTAEDAPRSVEFAIENRFHNVGLFSLYGFPDQKKRMGMPQMIPNHRLIHHDWRFFNSNFVVHFPMNMRPSRLQQGIMDGYREFDRFGCGPLGGMEGGAWPERRVLRTMARYCDYLKSVEEEFYNGKEQLMEDRLSEDCPARIKRLAI